MNMNTITKRIFGYIVLSEHLREQMHGFDFNIEGPG